MVGKMKQMLRLLALYTRMDFQWFTQDTAVCAVCIFSDLLSSIASISGLFLLAVRFTGVGGLTADEVLFMLGFYTMAFGFTFMLTGSNNVNAMSRRIGRGQVDHMLIQPIPIWMQILTEGFLPVSGNANFICGVILMAVSASRIGITVTAGWLLLVILYTLLHMGIMTGINFLTGSAAFYRPAACEEISSIASDLMYTVGKYPLSGMPAWAITVLTTILPAGLLAWLPALTLLQKNEAGVTLLLPMTVMAVLLSLARFAFQKGMKYYVQKGINRYRTLGFRG